MGIQPTQPGDKGRKIVGELQSAFGYFRRQKWTNPADADVNDVHANITLTAAIQDIATGITNPDFPRVLSITGTKAGATLTGNVVITGTDIRGNALSETIALNGDNTVAGTKAFKTVTNIRVPVKVTTGDVVSVGFTDALGLDRCMQGDEVALVTMDGVYEGTRPTVTFSSTVIALNTVDPNTALDTAKDVVCDYFTTEKTSAVQTTA